MNAHVQSPMSYAQRLQAEHKARQARWRAAARRVPQDPKVLPPKQDYVRTMVKQIPLWTMEPIHFDDHVKALDRWRAEIFLAPASPLRTYIKRRCEELEVEYRAIMSVTRRRDVVEARQLIMWEIKTHVKPEITLPELGRLFDRDHTTVLHAVRRVEEKRARGE